MSMGGLNPIPDHVAFGDPDRRPRCAQGGPEIANLFVSDGAEAFKAARAICYRCPLGPLWPDDVCATWRKAHPEVGAVGAVYGGRWFEGKQT